MAKGKLYLIPITLGDAPPEQVIPKGVYDTVKHIDEFVVENEKTARRYLKKLNIDTHLNDLILHPLNKHTEPQDIIHYLDNAEKGRDIGVISEAGCPGIADPGAEVVKLAHSKGIQVIPLVGPSSILLALISSGFNGQTFTFHGYLPIEKRDRINAIKDIERNAAKGHTQIFMEAPYRNNKLLEDIISSCSPDSRLCIAVDITLPSETIKTQTVKDWKNSKADYHKRPAIFAMG